MVIKLWCNNRIHSRLQIGSGCICQTLVSAYCAGVECRNLAGLLGAAVVGPGLSLGAAGAVAGYVTFRWVYSKTEQ